MKLNEKYFVEKSIEEKMIAQNNGIYVRYTDPVLTREHIPVEW